MNHIKRAFTSITRRPGKSIILLFLVFILGTVIAGALAVDGAITSTDANLRRNMRPILTTNFNNEAFHNERDFIYDRPEQLTSDIARRIGNIPYISHFDYSYGASVGSFELTIENIYQFDDIPQDWLNLRLRGTSNLELMDVTEGTIQLIDGRMFTQDEIDTGAYVTLISRELAEANNLHIGSAITVTSNIFNQTPDMWRTPDIDSDIFAYQDYELEIIGIFDTPRKDVHGLSDMDAHQELARVSQIIRRLYVPNNLAGPAQTFNNEQNSRMVIENDLPEFWLIEETINLFFVLDDPFDLEAFRELAEPMLPEFWQLIDLTDTFGAISTSMTTLGDIANWILIIAIAGSITVLSLLILLFLRDRRYEVGVYLALGEKKAKITAQIVLEVVTTALVGIILAMFTGNIIANQMSRNMLQNELTTLTEPVDWGAALFWDQNSLSAQWGGMGVEEMTMEQMMEAFDLTLSLETTLIFYGIGILVVTLSTVLPVLYITRLNPKKVLMEAKN